MAACHVLLKLHADEAMHSSSKKARQCAACLHKLGAPQVEDELGEKGQLRLQHEGGGLVLSVIPKPGSQSAGQGSTSLPCLTV